MWDLSVKIKFSMDFKGMVKESTSLKDFFFFLRHITGSDLGGRYCKYGCEILPPTHM